MRCEICGFRVRRLSGKRWPYKTRAQYMEAHAEGRAHKTRYRVKGVLGVDKDKKPNPRTVAGRWAA
jgi:hypothetical protein